MYGSLQILIESLPFDPNVMILKSPPLETSKADYYAFAAVLRFNSFFMISIFASAIL